MKLYEYVYNKQTKNNPVGISEYEVDCLEYDTFYAFEGCHGRRCVHKNLIGKVSNGDTVFLEQSNPAHAKEIFLQYITSKIEDCDRTLRRLKENYKDLSDLVIDKGNNFEEIEQDIRE